jgi:ABC-type Fe3+/spermidine/putrescine transport system ATPase subunit
MSSSTSIRTPTGFKVEAVRGVNLVPQAGQIVTVIGPNGAGKTTLLAAIAGLLRCRGRMFFDGADLDRLDVEERVERGFCLVPERRELFGDMPVVDNLLLGAYARRHQAEVKEDLQQVYRRFPRLAERRSLAIVASLRDLGVSVLLVDRSAFDLQAVFETVAESSIRPCGADRAFIYRSDGELLRMVVAYNASAELSQWLERHPIRPGRHSSAARAALERRTIHTPRRVS